ncbi:MAG TPA: vWA domain-containing protein [Desulfobacterales bacterium]|nr:vWA domain-containing protein [Desulfobacterales bacterium]
MKRKLISWCIIFLLFFCFSSFLQAQTAQDLNLSIAFVVDASGSMSGKKLVAAKDSVRNAVNNLKPDLGVEMALLVFSGCGSCRLLQDFTQDPNAILSKLTFNAGGGTPLAFSINKAGSYLVTRGRGKRGKIILLSDGGESCSGNPVTAAESVHKQTISVAMYPDNWNLSDTQKQRIKGVVTYLNKLAEQMLRKQPPDVRNAEMLKQYATEIYNANLYYKKNTWLNKEGLASTSFLGNITLYDKFFGMDFFSKGSIMLEDKDFAEPASLLIHEICHKNGGDEWDGHVLQRETFDLLGLPSGSFLRTNIDSFFLRFPTRTWKVKFYYVPWVGEN